MFCWRQIPRRSPGISCTALRTIASDRQFEVVFDKVRVPRKNMLGEPDRGWAVVKEMLPKAMRRLIRWLLRESRAVIAKI